MIFLTLFSYVLWPLASNLYNRQVEFHIEREIDNRLREIGIEAFYRRNYLFGGREPPGVVSITSGVLGHDQQWAETVWPKWSLASVFLFPETVDLPRSFRRLCRLQQISGFKLTDDGLDTLKHLPLLRVLRVRKAYSDGKAIDVSRVPQLESLVLEGNWQYPITDSDLKPFVGSRSLLSLESSGLVKISPKVAEQLMNNPFLRRIHLRDLDSNDDVEWRRLERLHPYMDTLFRRSRGRFDFKWVQTDSYFRVEPVPIRIEEPECQKRSQANQWMSRVDKWVEAINNGDVDTERIKAEHPHMAKWLEVFAKGYMEHADKVPLALALDGIYTYYKKFIRPNVVDGIVLKHPGLVSKVEFTPDGTKLISASTDGVRVWDWAGKKTLTHFEQVQGWVQFALSPDGTYLAFGAEKCVLLWDLTESRLLHTIDSFPDNVTCMAFAPDSSLLVVGCFDGSVHWLREPFCRVNGSWIAGQRRVHQLCFLDSDKLLTVIDERPDPIYYYLTRNSALWVIPRFDGGLCYYWRDAPTDGYCASVIPSTYWFVTGGRYAWLPGLVAWRVDWWSGLGRFSGVLQLPYHDPNEEWRVDEWSELQHAFEGIDAVHATVVFPNGKYLAAAGSKGDVRIMDLSDRGVQVLRLHKHDGLVLSLAASPDCRYVASAGKDGTVRVWEVGRFLGK